MKEKLTKEDLSKLSISGCDSGFTLWLDGDEDGRRWLIDGSEVLESGEIDIGSLKCSNGDHICAVFDAESSKIILMKDNADSAPSVDRINEELDLLREEIRQLDGASYKMTDKGLLCDLSLIRDVELLEARIKTLEWVLKGGEL